MPNWCFRWELMASDAGSIALRVALLVPLIGALFPVHPESSYACKCAVPGSPSEELAKSAAVFQGQVVSVRELDRSEATPVHMTQ